MGVNAEPPYDDEPDDANARLRDYLKRGPLA
jgi:hypothetical protein